MNRWELPEGWEWKTVGEIAEVRLGRQRSPDRATGPNLRPYLRAANVTWNGLDLSDIKEMDFTPKEQTIYQLEVGDIVLSEASGSASEVGKPALWNGEIEGCCFQNTLVRVRATPELAHYLLRYFRYLAKTGVFAAASKGSGIHHLGQEGMASTDVPIPPPDEQTRIVARLNDLQARIATARAGLDELRELAAALKRSVLDAAFRGELTAAWREAHPLEDRGDVPPRAPPEGEGLRALAPRAEPASALLDRLRAERRRRWQETHPKKPYVAPEPVDATDLPELPEGWCWAALEEITDFVTSGSRGWAEHYADSGALFIRVGNLDRDTISLDLTERTHVRPPVGAEGDRTRLAAGDILVSITADVGMVGLIPEGIGEAYVNQHVAMIRPVPGVRPAILAWGLLNPHGAGPIINESHYGMTKASLSLPQVRRLPVALPPEGEHQPLVEAIASSLATAERVVASAKELADDLTTTERALLTAAFRGELLPPADP